MKTDFNMAFIHPVGGSTQCYHHLVASLRGVKKMIGINHPDLYHDKIAEYRSISDLAALYCHQTVLSLGSIPDVLLGWSLGGIIGHAMARVWEKMGEKPGKLIFIDSPLADSSYVHYAKQLVKNFDGISNQRRVVHIALNADFQAHLDREYGLHKLRHKTVGRELENIDSVHAAGVMALAEYSYPPIAGDVDYILPRVSRNAESIEAARQKLLAITTGTIRVWAADGDHFSVIKPSEAKDYKNIINIILDGNTI